MIELCCDSCGKQYKLEDRFAGKRVRCKCGKALSVPAMELEDPFAQPAEPIPFASLEVAPRSEPRRVAPPPPIVRCRSCGGMLPPGAILCIDCGVNQQTGRAPVDRIGSGLSTPIAFIPTWVRITIVAVFCLLLLIFGAMIYRGKRAEQKRDEFETAQRKTLEEAQDAKEQAEKAKAQWARAGVSPVNVPGQPTATAAPAGRVAKPIYWVRPPAEVQPDGIEVYPMTISGGGPGLPMRIKLYLPGGRHEKASLPCVFIAPAGTRLIHGASLGRLALDDNSAEHLPYVRAGFAVLNYELSGNLPTPFNAVQMTDAVRRFIEADGGVANGRNAVDYVFEKVPEVDTLRLYAAGHGSAATMALNLCAAYPHFRAVAAYAPVCDLERHDPALLTAVGSSISGMDQFAVRISPVHHVADFTCPVLLFHANDDTVVSTADNARFAALMANAGHPVQFKEVPTGGHYNSMFNEGIPLGIEFFKANGAAPLPPIP